MVINGVRLHWFYIYVALCSALIRAAGILNDAQYAPSTPVPLGNNCLLPNVQGIFKGLTDKPLIGYSERSASSLIASKSVSGRRMATQGKGNKQASALVGFANADKPILFPGMGRIRKNRHGLAKCGFYFCYFNAVLLALFQVATIPIESCYILYSHVLWWAFVCTFVKF